MVALDNIAVYKAYIRARYDPKKTVTDVANEFGITRATVYEIVRNIEHGNPVKIKRCIAGSRLNCLWENKYKSQFMVIPKDREKESVKALRTLIKEMHKDGFNVLKIASLITKDRSTVLYHINSKNGNSK